MSRFISAGPIRKTVVLILAAVIAALATPAANAAPASRPTVDMELVVIAAQLDQYRPDNRPTPKAADDVKSVQRALRSKGYKVALDGNFGGKTVAAYAAWQGKLGYSGLAANGLPGRSSLERLGLKLTRMVPPPGKRVSYSGVTLNKRTVAMLKAAGGTLGCVLDVTKGSFTGPDDDSAGTHAGGGAADINVDRLCGRPVGRVVKALRTVGFAAWYRSPSQFPEAHIHAVAISDLDMSTESAFPGVFDAREQVVGAVQGKDGLKAAVVGPMTANLTTWERYKRAR